MTVGSVINWNTLTGAKATAYSIANLLNNSTITTGSLGVADAIQQEAFDMIWRRLRHWRMIPAPVTGTLTIGNDFLTPPADMLEPYFLCVTGTNFQEIVQKTPNDIISSWQFDSSGNRVQQQPMVYYFDQAALRFDSPADQAYPYALVYYQQPAELSATNLTNFVTQFCARLLKAAIMVAGVEWAKESGQGQFDRTYWEQAFENELQRVQAESDRSKRAIVVGAEFVGGGGIGIQPIYSW